jgi:hypothetical protein
LDDIKKEMILIVQKAREGNEESVMNLYKEISLLAAKNERYNNINQMKLPNIEDKIKITFVISRGLPRDAPVPYLLEENLSLPTKSDA